MVYIYLNTYANGYMYVGSHKWDGEGIDPEYQGSSYVAKHYGWHPIKIEILEVLDKCSLLRERYWIERYAHQYGIASCAKVLGGKKTDSWTSQFNNGLMLNLHSNDASQACQAARSVESRRKMTESRTKSGAKDRSVKAMLAGLTDEARRRGYDRIDYKEQHRKASITRKGVPGKYRVCSVIYDGFKYTGSVQTVCRAIGHEGWNSYITSKFKSGLTKVVRDCLEFVLISEDKKVLDVIKESVF